MTAFPKPTPRAKVRKPLRSRSRLSRKSPLRRSRIQARPPRRLSSPDVAAGRHYMAFVRTLPCAARFISPCSGAMHAHHAGKRPGVGMKCSDFETIPLCRGHHDAWHAGFPPFRYWAQAARREWADENIAFTRKVFADSHRESGLPVPATGTVAA